jgi:EmrB/QacA subfamily drug resistance transporter
MFTLKPPCDEAAILSSTTATHGQRGGTWVLVCTILGTSMAFIDGTVVNVAIPAMQVSLHATVSDAQWIVESYALILAALLLVGGAMGDIYGRRRIFVWGVVVFAAGSTWCGLSHSITSLILARGVQGLGGAMLIPGSLALISASFSSAERGKAIGTWSGFTAITTAIGPVFGGWLVDHRSWRWVFFVNVPIAVVVVVLSLWRVPESRNEAVGRTLDWPGAALATIGLCAVTFALIEAPHGGLPVKLATVAGVLALICFPFVEAHSSSPMVSPKLFRSRDFTAANLITFFLYAAFGGMLFFLPLDLIQVQHYSATAAGSALLPLILIIFLLSRWSGGLIARYGSRMPLVIGSCVAGLGFGLFLRVGSGGSYWITLFPAVVVLGLGMAISVAPLTTTVMNSVPVSEAGVASGVNNAVSRVAGLMAIAIFGLILYVRFNTVLDRELQGFSLSPDQRYQVNEQRPRLAAAEASTPQVRRALDDAFSSGFRAVLLTAMGCALAGSLIGFAMLENRQTSMGAPQRH